MYTDILWLSCVIDRPLDPLDALKALFVIVLFIDIVLAQGTVDFCVLAYWTIYFGVLAYWAIYFGVLAYWAIYFGVLAYSVPPISPPPYRVWKTKCISIEWSHADCRISQCCELHYSLVESGLNLGLNILFLLWVPFDAEFSVDLHIKCPLLPPLGKKVMACWKYEDFLSVLVQ